MYTTSKQIYFDAPNVGEPEKEFLNKAIDEGYVSTFGPFVPEFEEKFSKYLGTHKGVAVQSGTAAIHMALHALAIGEGDEVIVPALTFVGSVNPIIYVGAIPVFVDVDPKTWNIDINKIEEVISNKTKAILPVHLYGNPCDMEGILDIAKKYNLHVIEDACESLGALYNGRHTGTMGDFGCYSFNGNKVITTGGGGMVIDNMDKNNERIKYLINQAKSQKDETNHKEIGFNYRMTNLEAAVGLAQLKQLEGFLAKKRTFRKIYSESIKVNGGVDFQRECTNGESSWWLNCLRLNKGRNIEYIIKVLEEKGVPVKRVFEPVVNFPPYGKFSKGDFMNSQRIYNESLALPSSTLNDEESIQFVCHCLNEVLADG